MHTTDESMGEDTTEAGKSKRKEKSKAAAILLMTLCALTYLPLLVFWEGQTAFFAVLLVGLIVSFAFQVSLIAQKSVWAWWGSAISWFADIIIVIVANTYSLDPTGFFTAIVIVVVGIPAMILLLWDQVSDLVAIALSCVIVAVAILLVSFASG